MISKNNSMPMSEELQKGKPRQKQKIRTKKNQEKLFISLKTDDIIVVSDWDLNCISLEK